MGNYKVNKLKIDDELLDFVRGRWSIMYDTYVRLSTTIHPIAANTSL